MELMKHSYSDFLKIREIAHQKHWNFARKKTIFFLQKELPWKSRLKKRLILRDFLVQDASFGV